MGYGLRVTSYELPIFIEINDLFVFFSFTTMDIYTGVWDAAGLILLQKYEWL